MSTTNQNITLNEPIYYHRDYTNDIPVPAKTGSWEDQSIIERCQRVFNVAVPFVTLYQPLNFPVTLGLGAIRSVTSTSQLIACIQNGGDLKAISYQTLQTAIAVISLVSTVFAHPLGMLVTTAQDLIIDATKLVQYIQAGDYQKALETCASILNNSLYLALFLHGGLELSIASLAVQILSEIYRAQSEFAQGRYLEGAGHVALALIRCNQIIGQVQALQQRWEMEEAAKKFQERVIEHLSEAIRENKDPVVLAFQIDDLEMADYLLQMSNAANEEHLFDFPGYEFQASNNGYYNLPIWQRAVSIKRRVGNAPMHFVEQSRVNLDVIKVLMKHDQTKLWHKYSDEWLNKAYFSGDLEAIAFLYPITKQCNPNYNFPVNEQRYLIDPFLSGLVLDLNNKSHIYIPQSRWDFVTASSLFDYRADDNTQVKELKTQIQQMLEQP